MRVQSLLAAIAALVASAVVVLPGVARGSAQAGYEPRFEPAPCPDLPEPVASGERSHELRRHPETSGLRGTIERRH
jgi:hypothetical protein